MPTPGQKKLLKAKIAVALQDELGQVPAKKEIDQVFLLTRLMYNLVLGLHFKRQEQIRNHPKIRAFWGFMVRQAPHNTINITPSDK
jgi:hypothetical protein